jgi:Response regulator containing a CheY-like receiver domain and an HTH DNA-binding domain
MVHLFSTSKHPEYGKAGTGFCSASTVIAYDEQTHLPLYSLTLALRMHQHMPIIPKLERLVSENAFLKANLDLYITLTKREKEMLRLMALGMTPKEISEQVITSEKTVRTHRRNIKRKLHIKKEVDLVYFAQAF